jgi:hypothetical protein
LVAFTQVAVAGVATTEHRTLLLAALVAVEGLLVLVLQILAEAERGVRRLLVEQRVVRV